jgi:hypothetical protein
MVKVMKEYELINPSLVEIDTFIEQFNTSIARFVAKIRFLVIGLNGGLRSRNYISGPFTYIDLVNLATVSDEKFLTLRYKLKSSFDKQNDPVISPKIFKEDYSQIEPLTLKENITKIKSSLMKQEWKFIKGDKMYPITGLIEFTIENDNNRYLFQFLLSKFYIIM